MDGRIGSPSTCDEPTRQRFTLREAAHRMMALLTMGTTPGRFLDPRPQERRGVSSPEDASERRVLGTSAFPMAHLLLNSGFSHRSENR